MQAEAGLPRHVATTGTVLIGLYFVLTGLAGIAWLFALATSPEWHLTEIASSVPFLIASVVPGAALVFGRRHVTQLIQAGADTRPVHGAELLAVAVALFGLFLLAEGLTHAGQSAAALLALPTGYGDSVAATQHRTTIIAAAFKVTAGSFLTLRPGSLLRLL